MYLTSRCASFRHDNDPFGPFLSCSGGLQVSDAASLLGLTEAEVGDMVGRSPHFLTRDYRWGAGGRGRACGCGPGDRGDEAQGQV